MCTHRYTYNKNLIFLQFEVYEDKNKIKAIICSKDTANDVKQTLAIMDEEMKKSILLLSFGQVEGFENISSKLDHVDGNIAPKPIISDTAKDYCLVVWNLHGDSMCCEHGNLCQHKLSHYTVFYSTK